MVELASGDFLGIGGYLGPYITSPFENCIPKALITRD